MSRVKRSDIYRMMFKWIGLTDYRERKKLKQMFKMMSLRTDAGPETPSSFTNGRIDHCLLHVRPHLDQTLFQLIHIMYGILVHAFLNTAPNFIIERLRSGLLGSHRSGDMNSGVAWCRYLTVACARWAGTLSCWNMNTSTARCQIAGSI